LRFCLQSLMWISSCHSWSNCTPEDMDWNQDQEQVIHTHVNEMSIIEDNTRWNWKFSFAGGSIGSNYNLELRKKISCTHY
jgi:hypothetical protein